MPSKKAPSRSTSGFNYDLLIDVIAIGCILVIAGRPDALAITVSAVILAVFIVIFRATVGAKAYLSSPGRGRVAVADDIPRTAPAPVEAADTPPSSADDGKRSWLRE